MKTDFTEYYNFIYKYKSDCLSADFSYNKTFYKDLSHLSKNMNYSKKKKLNLFEKVLRKIKGKLGGINFPKK